MADLASPNSAAVVTVTVPSFTGRWWLKDVLVSTTVQLFVHDDRLQLDSTEDVTVFSPVGRTRPVVVYGVGVGETGKLTLSVLTDSDYAAIETMRKSRRTLLLQSPLGESLYVQLAAPRGRSHMLGPGTRKQLVELGFVEVDVP